MLPHLPKLICSSLIRCDMKAISLTRLPICQMIAEPTITWHGTTLGQPDWNYDSHSLAFTLRYGEFNERSSVVLMACA